MHCCRGSNNEAPGRDPSLTRVHGPANSGGGPLDAKLVQNGSVMIAKCNKVLPDRSRLRHNNIKTNCSKLKMILS